MSVEFSYRLHHSYEQYLSQQYLKENIDTVVAKNVREAVGSIESIYEANTDRITASLTDIQCRMDQTNDALEQLSFGLDGIQGTLDVINGNIVSGFQAMFVQFDELNSSLAHIGRGIDDLNRGIDALVEIGRTPVQTWALNQFEIARDSARRKLFPEALESLNFAIGGTAQNTGLKTNYRFHQLRGVLLLGIPGEPDTIDIVDLEGAEASFLLAARYAQHDDPVEAAQALVGAGKAAYADRRLAEAQKHYIAALETDAKCGEANYQMARLSVHAKDMKTVEYYLSNAFDIHWSYAMRAAEDAQFVDMTQLVERCVRSTTERIIQDIQPPMQKLVQGVKFIKEREFDLLPMTSFAEHSLVIADIVKAKDALQVRRLKDVFEIRRYLPKTRDTLGRLAGSYSERLLSNPSIVSQGTLAPPASVSVSSQYTNPDRVANTAGTIAGFSALAIGLLIWHREIMTGVQAKHDYVIGILLTGIFAVPAIGIGIAIAVWLVVFLARAMTKASNESSRYRAEAKSRKIEKQGRKIEERNRAIMDANSAVALQRSKEIRSHFGLPL